MLSVKTVCFHSVFYWYFTQCSTLGGFGVVITHNVQNKNTLKKIFFNPNSTIWANPRLFLSSTLLWGRCLMAQVAECWKNVGIYFFMWDVITPCGSSSEGCSAAVGQRSLLIQINGNNWDQWSQRLPADSIYHLCNSHERTAC